MSSTAQSAITTTKNHKGRTGFHIVVDNDGSITQINNLENRANHVGKPKGEISNYNSIGIEVVGRYLGKEDGKDKWESLTAEQIENTSQAVFSIMGEYNLELEDI